MTILRTFFLLFFELFFELFSDCEKQNYEKDDVDDSAHARYLDLVGLGTNRARTTQAQPGASPGG